MRLIQRLVLLATPLLLGACSYIPFLNTDKPPLPLPAVTGNASLTVNWQSPLGSKQSSTLMPASVADRVYAAHPSGAIVTYDRKSGATVARFDLPAGKGHISGGVGASATMVVVGTSKAEVIAFDSSGKVLWTGRVGSEVIAPVAISDDVVVVLSGDGSFAGLDAKTGVRKWVITRSLPPLTVRSSAIPVATRGGVFVGTPQGKLLAFDASTGAIGWESTVANPKGASELERLVDVIGQPVLDADKVCAAAYQGRVACFDILRGTLRWSRDISTLTPIAADNKNVYLIDDKGFAHAFDKATGGSVWKQDVLAGRRATGSAMIGGYFAVQDTSGAVHLVEAATGRIAGRGLGDAFASDVSLVSAGEDAIIQTRTGLVASISAR